MTFKTFRDGRPLDERPAQVQMEAELHASIRGILTKKEQGNVMGAFRAVIEKHYPRGDHNG